MRRTLLIAALMLDVAAPAVAVQEPPLCAFVKRVLADRPNEFSVFKGAPDTAGSRGIMFKGTAAPDGQITCNLRVRVKFQGKTEEPNYSCWSPRLPVAEGKALYERRANDLRACLGGAAISEERLNEESGIPRHWQWTAQTADYSVEIWMGDLEAIVNLLLVRPTGEPGMEVEVRITDLSPPRPGAIIPELQWPSTKR